MKQTLALVLFLISLLPLAAIAADLPATAELEHSRVTLVSEYNGIEAGKPLSLAFMLEPKAGWHTYWENPGDAGMPISLTWTLPDEFKAGNIDWPAPENLTEGPLVTYAYKSTVFLPVAVATPAGLDASKDYTLKVKAEWLICENICVPESAELALTLPVYKTASPTAAAPLFEQHRQHRPIPITEPGSFKINGKELVLSLPLAALKNKEVKSAQFFIREQNILNYAAMQKPVLMPDSLQLTAQRAEEEPGDTISGILTVTANDNTVTHYNVVFKSANAAAAAQPPQAKAQAPAEESPWFFGVLLSALLGGLILNLMPCVLPVLSLKALAIARKSGRKHEHVAQQGIAYTVGILLTFALIAGVLIGVRHAGAAVGWGYQMQSPAFVGFLIYLLFLVGLSLSGVFHLPVLLGNVGSDIANENSARGSFFTGVLATAVATPCTAPFMASAVGAALTMPTLQALLVFEAMGLGLALPFLLISLFPALRRFLPKPGAWMDTFRQLIAFPMYASVIWLMWVLTLQTGAGGMVLALSGMLLIVIILWMKSLFADGSRVYPFTALALFAALLAFSLPELSHMEIDTAALPGGHMEYGVETVDYSKEKLDALLKEGKPVFVDATAAWCITCQVNARVALHTDATMKLFKERGITLMIADWTRRNDAITEFLSSFGYKGVPLCVYYPPGNKKPVVMPQILTQDAVIQTIKGE